MLLALQTTAGNGSTVTESAGAVGVELVVIKGSVDRQVTVELTTGPQGNSGDTAFQGVCRTSIQYLKPLTSDQRRGAKDSNW